MANKFQTDFDEPLLSVMYVDKCLGGIQAAQTLARLNRCHQVRGRMRERPAGDPGLAQDVPPGRRTGRQTDLNRVFALRDGQALYDTFEVEHVVQVVLKGAKARQSALAAALMPVAQRPLITYTQACHAFDADDEGRRTRQQAKTESMHWGCPSATSEPPSDSAASCRRSSTTATSTSKSARIS